MSSETDPGNVDGKVAAIDVLTVAISSGDPINLFETQTVLHQLGLTSQEIQDYTTLAEQSVATVEDAMEISGESDV